MTIALAAYSHPDRSIVMVSDRMVTMGNRTADNSTIKWYAIHGDWSVEFGGDVGLGSKVMQRAIPLLDAKSPHSAVSVGDALGQAWLVERATVVNAEAMSSYGLTIEQLTKLRPGVARKVSRSVPGCELLVSGFDPDAYPHVLWLGLDGKVRDCDSFGYWAIGTGSDLALASLALREQSFRLDTVTTLYHLLEGRFAAEADANVGKGETLAMVFRHRAPVVGLEGHEISLVRALWKVQHRGYPGDVLNQLRAMLTASGSADRS